MDRLDAFVWTVTSKGFPMGIRPLTPQDMCYVTRLIDGEGWLKSAQSVLAISALSTRGALVAVNTDGGVIAFITSVDIGHQETAVLSIIVDKDYRKFGVGRELIDSLANTSEDEERVISLLAYPGAETFYSDIGFHTVDNMTIVVNFITPDFDFMANRARDWISDVTVCPLGSLPLPVLTDYDEKVCGYFRDSYLSSIMVPGASCVMVAYTNDSSNNIAGYCGAHMAKEDTLCIAPLYANSKDIAEALFTRTVMKCKENLDFSQIKVITPKFKPFLTSFGPVTRSLSLLMMANGDINFGLSDKVYSCINTSFP